MSTRCVIRFVDESRQEQAIVSRARHHHPDQVVLNLAELEELTKSIGTAQKPRKIAAQFVFIDKLWYLIYLRERENVEEEILTLLDEPDEVHRKSEYYLGCHSIGLPSDEVENQYLFEVTVQEGNWGLKFGRKEEKLEEGVFGRMDWELQGKLTNEKN